MLKQKRAVRESFIHEVLSREDPPSRQAIWMSGSHLNIIANSRVSTPKSTTKLTAVRIAADDPPLQYLAAALSTVVVNSETVSRKPKPITAASESTYLRA